MNKLSIKNVNENIQVIADIPERRNTQFLVNIQNLIFMNKKKKSQSQFSRMKQFSIDVDPLKPFPSSYKNEGLSLFCLLFETPVEPDCEIVPLHTSSVLKNIQRSQMV